jgi:putative endonuclease
MRPSGKRQNAYRFGQFSELLCCWHLRLGGYQILQRGFRATTGEIDIIARRAQTLAFVEVKARANLNNATHALQPAQRSRIERTAQVYLASHPEFSGDDMRFDLMIVAPWGWPEHLKGAWMTNE